MEDLPVDPVTREIIRRALLAIADEMKWTLMRAAHNPIIYEVLDFSVGVFSAKAEALAQAAGLPIFLANLGAAIEDGLKVIGAENMKPGDVIVTNDPYTTGTHLPDVTMYAPVFVDGELIGFTAARAHWVDIGGRAPGGWFTDTVEVYQEGLRLRSVKLFEEGKPTWVVEVIKTNVRYPESIYGDMMAEVAAVRTGAARLVELVKKYGKRTYLEAVEDILDQSERYVREEIRKMKPGTYRAEGFIESIKGDEPIRIVVSVRVDADRGEVEVDLTGTSPQRPEPLNCGVAAAISACRVAFRAVTKPDLPTDEGTFRPLKVVVPPGTVVSAQPPAPVSLYGLPLMTLMDLIIKAVAEAAPHKVIAGMYDDVDATFIWGVDPRTGKPYIHIEPEGGGWGAKPFEDGENVLIAIADGDTYNVPVEVVETRFPLVIEQYGIVPNGGPGKYRGGGGMVRVYYVDHEAYTTLTYFRNRYPAWGLFGGYPAFGVNTAIIVKPGNKIEVVQYTTALKLEPGTRLVLVSGGGGGYGDPLDREPELVLRDVLDGFTTLDEAREVYGVVIDPGTMRIDYEETKALRAKLKEYRKRPDHCPEHGYIYPVTKVDAKLVDKHKLLLRHTYECPVCGTVTYVKETPIELVRSFDKE